MGQLLNVLSSISSLSLLRTVCYVIEFYLLLYLWVLLVMRMLNFINLCLSYLLREGSVCASSWIAVPHLVAAVLR